MITLLFVAGSLLQNKFSIVVSSFFLLGVSFLLIAGEEANAQQFEHEDGCIAAIVKKEVQASGATIQGDIQVQEQGGTQYTAATKHEGRLFMPGAPELRVASSGNKKSSASGAVKAIIQGGGSGVPKDYPLKVLAWSELETLVTHTDPVDFPSALPLIAGVGTRSVHLKESSDSVGDFSTLKNLKLSKNAGMVAMLPGRYNDLAVSGRGNGFILGVAGSTERQEYHFDSLVVGPNNTIRLVGPVRIVLGSDFALHSSMGNSDAPEDLEIHIAGGGFSMMPSSCLYGEVFVPDGKMHMHPRSILKGRVYADTLKIQNDAKLICGVTDSNTTPPIAENLSVDVLEDEFAAIELLGNSPGSLPMTYGVMSQPTHGALTGTIPNLTYTPSSNYTGPDSFTYRVSDTNGDSDIATVSITVNAVNDIPVAENITDSVEEDTPLSVTLRAFDLEGDVLTYEVITPPANGVLSGAIPNLVYTPNLNVNGQDTFTYRVSDGGDVSNTATVTIDVIAVNDAPVSVALEKTTREDSLLEITLQASDVDGDTLTYEIVEQPQFGAAVIENGVITYIPNLNYHGTDTIRYVAKDDESTSNVALISINVTPVNDMPVAEALALTVDEDTNLNIELSGTDVDGDAITFVVETQPEHGSLSGSGSSLVYTPDPNYHGNDVFTYLVNDGAVNSETVAVNITVNPVNDAPVASSGVYSTNEDSPQAITLGGADVDGDLLTYVVVDQPASGTLSGTGQNLTFVPMVNMHGQVIFTYKVSDGELESNVETVTINVLPVNDAPVAQNVNVVTNEDTPVDFALLAADPDGDGLSYEILGHPSNGTLSGAVPNLTYVPAANFYGVETLSYKVNDGAVDSGVATITITVNPVNDAPVAQSASYNTNQDESVSVVLSGSDVDGDPLSYHVVNQPTNGTVQVVDGEYSYHPNIGFSGVDFFDFTANDGELTSRSAKIVVVVDSAPTVVVTSPMSGSNFDEEETVQLSARASDSDDTIIKSMLYLDGSLVAESASADISVSMESISSGEHTVKAESINSDGIRVKSEEVTIQIEPKNKKPIVNAGSDQSIALAAVFLDDLVVNGSNEEVNADGSLKGWTVVSGNWTTGVVAGGPTPVDGQKIFYAPTEDTNEIYQDVDVSALAEGIAKGVQYFQLKAFIRSKEKANRLDRPNVIIEYHDAESGMIESQRFNPTPVTDQWLVVSDLRAAPQNTDFIRIRLISDYSLSGTNDAYFDAVSLVPLETQQVFLSGTVSDDDRPTPESLTHAWSQVSGPQANVVEAESLLTALALPLPGDYVFRLTASDGEFEVFDELNITVSGPNNNLPPIVEAGSAIFQDFTTDEIAILGVATDATIPEGETLQYLWTQIEGPSDAVIANTAALATSVNFREPGKYVLRLTVNDGEYFVSDDLEVFMNCPGEIIPMDVAIMIDHSGSMGVTTDPASNVTRAREAAKLLVQAMNFEHDQVALGALDGVTTDLTSEQGVAYLGVDQIVGPSSSTDDGIGFAYDHLAANGRSEAQKLIIVLADGNFTEINAGSTRAKAGGARVVTIGLGASVNDDYLQQLASTPGDYYFIKNAEDINTVFATISRSICRFINKAPEVYAGAPISVREVEEPVLLNASYSDDNLPSGAIYTFQWSKVEGPGNVIFSQSTLLSPEVSFTESGEYVLELRVSDSNQTGRDYLTVKVGQECSMVTPEGLTAWWTGNSTIYDVITGLPLYSNEFTPRYEDAVVSKGFSFNNSNSLLAPISNQIDIDSYTDGFTVEGWFSNNTYKPTYYYSWENGNGNSNGLYTYLNSLRFYYTRNGNVREYLSVDMPFVSGQIYHVALVYSKSDSKLSMLIDGNVAITRTVESLTVESGRQFMIGGRTGFNTYYLDGFVDELSFYNRPLHTSEVAAIHDAGTNAKCLPSENAPPVVDAGKDFVVNAANMTSSVEGFASDASGISSVEWSVYHAPENASVVFADAGELSSSVSFSAPGFYSLKLTASDGYYTVSDLVAVRVQMPCGIPVDPSVRAWWQFDGHHENVIFESVNDWDRYVNLESGQVGLALTMTEASQALVVQPDSSTNLDAFPNGFTQECWVKPTNQEYGKIYHWSNGAFLYQYGNQGLRFYYKTAAGENNSNIVITALPAIDVWSHVAVTYDKSERLLTVYLNGIEVGSEVTDMYLDSDELLYIGPNPTSTGDSFETRYRGQIDELTFYDKALEDHQINAIYTAGSAGKCIDSLNDKPTVDAGNDIHFSSVGTAANLSATASDADGDDLTIEWTLVSGGSGVQISSPSSLSTEVSFTTAGIYTFEVSASDGYSTTTDIVRVYVGKLCVQEMPSGAKFWLTGEGSLTNEFNAQQGSIINGIDYADGMVGSGINLETINYRSHFEWSSETDIDSFDQGFALECWLQPNASQRIHVFGWYNHSFLYQYDSTLRFYYHPSEGADRTYLELGDIALGVFSHVAITYDRGTGMFTAYVNGTKVKEEVIPSIFSYSSKPLSLGSNYSDRVFKGVLDELTIYDRAISNEEVQGIYHAGMYGKCGPSGNTAPLVEAGDPIYLNGIGEVAQLDGQVAYDGSYQVTWQTVEAPDGAQVTYSDDSALRGTAQFSAEGIYRLALTVDDGFYQRVDYLEIYVNSPCLSDQDIPRASLWLPFNGSLLEEYSGEYLNNDAGQTDYADAAVFGGLNTSGTSRHVIADEKVADYTSDAGLTIDFWVVPEVVSETKVTYIAHWNDPSVSRIYRYLDRLYILLNKEGGTYDRYICNGFFTDTNLVHAACVVDPVSNRVKVYKNGELFQTFGTSPLPTYKLQGELVIGSLRLRDLGFNGLLDEFAVTEAALTPEEVALIHDKAPVGRCRLQIDRAPQIDAGKDVLVQLPSAQHTLKALAVDDKTAQADLAYTWTLVSGPQGYTFSDISEKDVVLDFTNAGDYVFGLSVSDGTNVSSDTVEISVLPIENTRPVAEAGEDIYVYVGETVSLAASVVDDHLPINQLSYIWQQVAGPVTIQWNDADGPNPSAIFDEHGVYTFELTASDSQYESLDRVTVYVQEHGNQAPVVNAGADQVININSTNTATLMGQFSDDGLPRGDNFNLWLQVAGPPATLEQIDESTVMAYFTEEGNYEFAFQVSDGFESSIDTVLVQVIGNNDAPVVTLVDSQYTETNSIQLTANVTDDGNLQPLTYQWSLLQGSGTTIASPEALTTNVTLGGFGEHIFQLEIFDGQWTVTGTVTVNYADPNGNKPPVITLVENQSVVLSAGLSLGAVVTDDGLSGQPLSYSWSVDPVSPATGVSFVDSNALDTTSTFSGSGVYVLRLTVSDGEFIANALTQIQVRDNTPPGYYLQNEYYLVQPDTEIELSVTASDSEQAVESLVYTWTQVTGPGNAVFDDASLFNPRVTLATLGDYVFNVEISDGIASSQAQVVVHYLAAGNSSPQILPLSAADIQVTETFTPVVNVTDDGFPVGGSITYQWELVNGPEGGFYTISDPAVASPDFDFGTPGAYAFRLSVSDGPLTSSTIQLVSVYATAEAEMVSPVNGSVVINQGLLSLSADVTGYGQAVLSVDFYEGSSLLGSGTQYQDTVRYQLETSMLSLGQHTVHAVATLSGGDTVSTAPVTFSVSDFDETAFILEVTSPEFGDEISGSVDITGTVLSNNLDFYLVETTESGKNNWKAIATGTKPVADGTLATFDITLLRNGMHDIRVTAYNLTGGTLVAPIITVLVDSQMKLGHFNLAFEDLSIPISGIPLSVTRAYDSRGAEREDFGPGWDVGLNSMGIKKTGSLGENWEHTQGSLIDSYIPADYYCLTPTRRHRIAVVFPGGRTETFEAELEVDGIQSIALAGNLPSNCKFDGPVTTGTMQFVALNGSQGTLTLSTQSGDDASGSFAWEAGLGGLGVGKLTQGIANTSTFNPTTFRYTEPDGTSYVIDEVLGMLSLTDTNENTLTINAAGVHHSAGESILFTRDTANGNRITEVTDPAGQKILYGYDAEGRLSTVTNREGEVTSFFYENANFPHYLTRINDARGVQAIRSEYDESGRLVRQIDANGNAIEFEHDLVNNREIIRDRLGNVTIHEFDDYGNITSTTDALGGVTTREYDANDNETSMTTPEGVTTTRSFDSQNNLLTESDGAGNVTSYSYNSSKLPLTITDALGREKGMSYGINGNLTSMTDSAGTVTNFAHSGSGNLGSLTDANGTVTSYTHDSKGRELTMTVTDSSGAVLRGETYEYDTLGNRTKSATTRTLADGTVESLVKLYEFDAESRLTKTILPGGATSRTEYNSIGKQSKTIDALGRETLYEYDSRGNLILTSYPDTTTSSTAYDVEGRRTASTDQAGETTYFVYDALGRLVSTILPDDTMPSVILIEVVDILAAPELVDNPTTSTEYDGDGRVTASIDALGNHTEYEYDAAGRRVLVRDALNNETRTAYDDAGQQTSVTDALNRTTSFEYDAAGRLTTTTFHDGTTTQVDYDSLGRRTSATDQEGNETQFEYDDLGRLIAVADAENNRTEYEYNEQGSLLVQRDAKNRETKFTYDSLGRRLRRKLPQGQVEIVTYNLLGNTLTRQDFNGHTTTYGYNNMNRLTSVTADVAHPSLGLTHAPAKFEYGYDDLGRRISSTVKNNSGSILFERGWGFDARGHMTTATSTNGNIGYVYNANGNIGGARSDTVDGYDQSYDYDALNRLTTAYYGQEGVDSNAYGVVAYGYDAVGNMTGSGYANGVGHQYDYTALNRLQGLTVGKMSSGVNHPVISTIQQKYTYTLNNAGHRTHIAEYGGRNISHVFDKRYLLKSETITGDINGQNGATGYTHDKVGNRLTRTSSVSAVFNQNHAYTVNDHLSGDNVDANGNTLASPITHLADHSGSYTDVYDFRNKLVKRSYSGGKIIFLSHDADGHRVSKAVLDGALSLRERHYLVDTNNHTGYAQVVEEKDSNDTLTRVNLFGHDLVATNFLTEGCQRYYQYDGLGSVRALSDKDGDITDEYTYDAFGLLLSSTGSSPNNYLYTGEQWDADLGMYFLRARYMNVQTGRFHTMDTYEGRNGEPLTLHKYLYAHANPVSYYDPSGYFSLREMGAVFRTMFSLTKTMAVFNARFAFGTVLGLLKWRAAIYYLKPIMLGLASFERSLRGFEDIPMKTFVQKIKEKVKKINSRILIKAALQPAISQLGVGAGIGLFTYAMMDISNSVDEVVNMVNTIVGDKIEIVPRKSRALKNLVSFNAQPWLLVTWSDMAYHQAKSGTLTRIGAGSLAINELASELSKYGDVTIK